MSVSAFAKLARTSCNPVKCNPACTLLRSISVTTLPTTSLIALSAIDRSTTCWFLKTICLSVGISAAGSVLPRIAPSRYAIVGSSHRKLCSANPSPSIVIRYPIIPIARVGRRTFINSFLSISIHPR